MAENVRFGKTTEEICKNLVENSTPSATKSATNFAENIFKGTKLERASWLNVYTKQLFLETRRSDEGLTLETSAPPFYLTVV